MLNTKKALTKILTSLDEQFKIVNVATSSTSVGASQGAWKYGTATIPSGYTPIGFKKFGVNHGWINITGQSLSVSGTTLNVGFFCQNITNSAITCQCDAEVLLVKNTFF